MYHMYVYVSMYMYVSMYVRVCVYVLSLLNITYMNK